MALVIMGRREGWARLLDMYIIMAKILRKTLLWGIKWAEGFIMCSDEEIIMENHTSRSNAIIIIQQYRVQAKTNAIFLEYNSLQNSG